MSHFTSYHSQWHGVGVACFDKTLKKKIFKFKENLTENSQRTLSIEF